jgi:hypothetical protein
MKLRFDYVYNFGKFVLVCSGIFALTSIGLLAVNINRHSVPVANALLSSSNTFVNNSNKNESLAFIKADSILDNVQATTSNLKDASTNFYPLVRDVRLDVDNVNKAAIDERIYFEQTLPGVTSDVTTILNSTNKSMANVDGAVKDTQSIIKGFGPIESDLGTTVKSLNYFLNSPTITETMNNVQKTTDSASIAADAIAKGAVNLQQQENDYSKGFLNRLLRKIF